MFSVVVDIMTRTILATKTPPSIITSYLLAHLPAGPFNIKQTSKQEKKQPKIYKKWPRLSYGTGGNIIEKTATIASNLIIYE